VIYPTPLILLLTLVLPPLIFVAFTTSSMTVGLLISALAWALFGLATGRQPYYLQKSDAGRLGWLCAAILLLALHAAISHFQIGSVDFGRFSVSAAILAVVLIGAHFAARKLARLPDADLIRCANVALVTLTVLGLAAALGVPPVGPQASVKAVVVFSEPSHFGLAYLPVLLFRVSVARRGQQVALIAMAFLLAIVLQSLTMVVGLMIVAGLMLRARFLIPMLAVVIAGLALVAVDLTYYSSRLVFSADSDNVSTLVFMQGWENAILNFRETHGLGVGFQQFGIAGSTGEVADRIAEILGKNISLLDGGSTATKLTGEFGVFGLLTIVAFLVALYRAARFFRQSQLRPPAFRDPRRLFFHSFVVAYTIELFVRGAGYFSPGGFFLLVALMSLAARPTRTVAAGATNTIASDERLGATSLPS